MLLCCCVLHDVVDLDDVFPFITLEEFQALALVLRSEAQAHGHDLGIYVELKTPQLYLDEYNIRVEDVIVDVLRQGDAWLGKDHRLLFESFDLAALQRLAKKNTGKERVLLLEAGRNVSNAAIAEYAQSVDGLGLDKTILRKFDEGKEIVRACHQHKLLVHVWTFREAEKYWLAQNFTSFAKEITHYTLLEIDGFFTDDPGTVFHLLTQRSTDDIVSANLDNQAETASARAAGEARLQEVLGALLALSVIGCLAAIVFYAYLRCSKQAAFHYDKA